MIGNMSVRTGRLIALAAVLAGLCASMFALNTSAAHAEQYCWGYYLPGLEATCHLNHERYASEVRGMGGQHSVCVWQQPIGPMRCSSGPGVWVVNSYGTNYWGVPYIQDNAPGGTYGYGEAF
jgi:hypothetical protein